ncbi:MPN527 family putative ECF transporter permease subunit [Mesomycoplasma ovipneumoniae]|uniref:MPN527 family putative ECF transporter permease subunit n=1 Tax=Mesomycoplasma ovipneumoniae TaxID=29562 RepID=UPI00083E720E|nr:ECF transporter S component [Mesomycoplasma ovipneumoniae]
MKTSISWNSNLNFKIAFTGILFSLSLIFFSFSHNYLSWPFFQTLGLKIDLSTLFLVPIFLLGNFWLGFCSLLARFLIGPWLVFNRFGGIDIIYFGHFVLFLASIIYIFSFLGFRYLFIKIFKNFAKIKRFIILSLIISTLTTDLMMTFLNGILIFPVYLKLFNIIDSVSLNLVYKKWDGIQKSFSENANFSYWSFIFSVFIPFNLVNFAVPSILAFPIYMIIEHFHKNKTLN